MGLEIREFSAGFKVGFRWEREKWGESVGGLELEKRVHHFGFSGDC